MKSSCQHGAHLLNALRPDANGEAQTPSGKLFQKYTGLLASRRAAARLADLRALTCNHARHTTTPRMRRQRGARRGVPRAAMNDALVWALTGASVALDPSYKLTWVNRS